jgi:hypothetical protein
VEMGEQVADQSPYSVHGPAWPYRSRVMFLEGADEGLP